MAKRKPKSLRNKTKCPYGDMPCGICANYNIFGNIEHGNIKPSNIEPSNIEHCKKRYKK